MLVLTTKRTLPNAHRSRQTWRPSHCLPSHRRTWSVRRWSHKWRMHSGGDFSIADFRIEVPADGNNFVWGAFSEVKSEWCCQFCQSVKLCQGYVFNTRNLANPKVCTSFETWNIPTNLSVKFLAHGTTIRAAQKFCPSKLALRTLRFFFVLHRPTMYTHPTSFSPSV